MKKEKIFPLLDSLYVKQDDSLDQILIENNIIAPEEIDIDTFPLVLIGKDTILIPPVTFKDYAEIERHSLIINCFLNRIILKERARILDSRIFGGILGEESVMINSTIESSHFGKNSYCNQSTVLNSRLKNNVIICDASHIKDGLIDDDVVIQPQVVIDSAKIGQFSYIGSGAKILGKNDGVILEPKVFIGAGTIIEGPAMIGHNCYIDAGVQIISHTEPIYIPPFSYVKRDFISGFDVLERRSFYIIDGLWYVSKTSPFNSKEVRNTKRKLHLLEQEIRQRQIDIKDLLTKKSEKIENKTPVDLLLEEQGLKKFNEFLQITIESLVN